MEQEITQEHRKFIDAGDYWRVLNPDFLKPGNYSINKHKEIVEFCDANLDMPFIISDFYPPSFLSKKDAEFFVSNFGGVVKHQFNMPTF